MKQMDFLPRYWSIAARSLLNASQQKKHMNMFKFGTEKSYSTIHLLSPLESFLKEAIGLDYESIKHLEDKLLSIGIEDFQERIYNLNRFNINHNGIKHILLNSPELFLMHPNELLKKIQSIVSETGFSLSEMPDLFKKASVIFLDPLQDTVEKHTYLYFKMGFTNHKELASSGVMQYSMDHILQRHLFLLRRGQYSLKDRHGQTKTNNPILQSVFCTNDNEFCKLANCSTDEFNLFKDIIFRENRFLNKNYLDKDEMIESHASDAFADSLLDQLERGTNKK